VVRTVWTPLLLLMAALTAFAYAPSALSRLRLVRMDESKLRVDILLYFFQ
jgi:hypothetical protein